MSDARRTHDSIRTILKEIGEDPDREGLLRTPERVEKDIDVFSLCEHYPLDEAAPPPYLPARETRSRMMTRSIL